MTELARDADVLIENFRPGTLEHWDLGYDELSRENPGLVMVRVTGWGQDGPYRDRPGFGTLAGAISGWGSPERLPGEPADEHFRARRAIVDVDDAELGPTRACDVFPRLSSTPGRVRHLGPAPGGDTEQILVELGYGQDEIEKLRQAKVV